MLNSKEGARIKVDVPVYATPSATEATIKAMESENAALSTQVTELMTQLDRMKDNADAELSRELNDLKSQLSSAKAAARKAEAEAVAAKAQAGIAVDAANSSAKPEDALAEPVTSASVKPKTPAAVAETADRAVSARQVTPLSEGLDPNDVTSCKRICENAWKFHQQVVQHVIGSGQSNIDMRYVQSILNQHTISPEDTSEFVGILFEAITEYLSVEWNESMSKMRSMLHAADDLKDEYAGESIRRLVTAKRHSEFKRELRQYTTPKLTPALKRIEAKFKEQQAKWEKKKAFFKEKKARAILQCMESFMRVVTVNFKVQIAPGVIQDIKGHMYSSLVDDSPARAPPSVLGKAMNRYAELLQILATHSC